MARVFTITAGLENMGALRTGGQGSVYKARRIGEIFTAVKILPTPIYSESENDRHYIAFQNEVAKLSRVNTKPNPNVVKILSSGITETGSLPFIEMDFIEGPDLEELLQPPHDSIFTINEVIKVADQLSNALAHCHSVDVKHGDVKANNVKLNVHTGNYVLLDFGMAIMSDEQRRTSMRHAGAIEFMAPEQNEGHVLLQTDVYSFGVILFELLAGTVPFPLNDRGETARTQVMLAHMETEPPDVLELRRQALPAHWDEKKKEAEMLVPEWLINTIYICLEKSPQKRFDNGAALHQYIALRNIKTVSSIRATNGMADLQLENRRLTEENQRLKQQLKQYEQNRPPVSYATNIPPKKRRRSWVFPFLLVLALISMAVIWLSTRDRNMDTKPLANSRPQERTLVLGQYKVVAQRAYFYDQPDLSTRREAFMIPSDDVVDATEEKDGFVYTEFRNTRGQLSKGWIRKSDLMTLEQWKMQQAESPQQDVAEQLRTARRLAADKKFDEAIAIYEPLMRKEIPEAMYEWGNLGLQQKQLFIECADALSQIKRASDKGYVPAKRTLGFLYVFADNPDVLSINNYDHCTYERNVFKGTKLLMEAVTAGDSTASRLMEEINLTNQNEPTDTVEQ